MDKLVAMRTFRRVVELGGFAAAARDLGLSNAAVSKHVAELEAHLGATLLTRTTRRLSVTEAGRGYYDRCARILDDVREADIAVRELQTAPRGLLRVNAPMSFGLKHLSPILPEFMARYPEVRVDLAMNDRVVDLIEEGFDVALRIRAELADSSLIARRLASVRRVLCASPAYLAKHGAPVAAEDLARHRCLVYSLSEAPNAWTLRRPGGEVTVKVEGWLTANSSLVLRDALLNGGGVALVPTFLIGSDLDDGRLTRILGDHEAAGRTLFAVYPPGRHLSPKVRAFVDFLAERFAPIPPWDLGWDAP